MRICIAAQRACGADARLERHSNRICLGRGCRSDSANGRDARRRGSIVYAAIGGCGREFFFCYYSLVFLREFNPESVYGVIDVCLCL